MMAESALSEKIQEFEDKQQWWWAAEAKRSKRLDYLRKAVWRKGSTGGAPISPIKLDLEPASRRIEFYKQFKNEPLPIRVAKMHSAMWDSDQIYIVDQSQIVGSKTPSPSTEGWEGAGGMGNAAVYNYPEILPEPLEESLKVVHDVGQFWDQEGDAMTRLVSGGDPEDMAKFHSGAIAWGSLIGGYSGKNYEYFMTGKRAFEDIIREIDEKIADAEEQTQGVSGPDILPLYNKLINWEAMKLSLEAGIKWARRYARLARIIAENFETDPKRKEELLRVAETCERVPAKPPRNLQESLQYDHFIQVLARKEQVEGAWPARPDYYHGPYYDQDVNIEKNITKEEALDLIGEFLIRAYDMPVVLAMGKWVREGLQGIAGTWVWTLGGVKPDGSDACNEMTIALMQAARLVRTPNPTFAFRWHPKVKEEVMREIFECIRHGLGYPAMRNDPILIANSMHWHRHPIEEARTWVHQACMSPCPTTKHGTQPMRMASATANCAKIMEYALWNGYDHVVNMQMGPMTGDAREFTDFEQLFQAWVKQMEWLFSLLTRTVNYARYVQSDVAPRPFLSGISQRAVDSGLDVMRPDGERGNAWITAFTWGENPDSLTAIKKLVVDDKKYTMAQLMEAMEANWDGYEEMRLDFVNAPKWGNDDDYADNMMLRCLRECARFSRELKDPSGNSWPILPENVSGNIHYSSIVRSLPNGRRQGDALYDGGISPGPGLDKKGPTAVLKSCGKIDHVTDGRAFLLNQRLSPTQLQGEKGYQLWRAYMKTWADLGIDHVQFNMVSDETLRAAQKDPEKYSEVIVRVAGYSAHFVDISRKTQDNIIQRTIQGIG
ncbi:MAG: formate acetyltransferase [Deltaproteobacteria bacterium]|nr:formate acetyltransferase [Deltaproteobacteria bacterium]